MRLAARLIALLVLALALASALAAVDSGVIRLGGSSPSNPAGSPDAGGDSSSPGTEGRRGFDYEAFDSRLQGLWFQRKAFLADGRDVDAVHQSELIRAFCAEEGVRRLDELAGALVAEANRYLSEGSYERALASLDLAEAFDPGRAQVRVARAVVAWKSGEGIVTAAREWVAGLRAASLEARRNLTLLNHLALVLVIALLGCVAIFALMMMVRYNLPFRHEVDEWLSRHGKERWSAAGGWACLFLPLLVWVGAGWAVLYWIVATFRFMRRGERLTAMALLVATAGAVPAYRVSVALYGISADPVVRTALASATGAYDPDRIVKLRRVVDAHPDDPTFHFLLAGLYKSGRYFEEAYEQYKRVLALAPATYQAYVNMGNIFFLTGQYGEAVTNYRKALDLNPDVVLVYYNMHLAQSESFSFKEAEESLRKAREFNAKATAELLSGEGREGQRQMVVDASVDVGSIWQATLEGRQLRESLESNARGGLWRPLPKQLLNPFSVMAILTLLACPAILLASRGRAPAQRCLRCGRPFCHLCKSHREGHDYCSQCVHLFVLGDGLAPETKMKKMYEVERHERVHRSARRLVSLLLPGAGHMLRGDPVRGSLLAFLWLTAVIAWKPAALLPLERLLDVSLRLDVLRPAVVPAMFVLDPTGLVALVVGAAVWTIGNTLHWRAREA